MQRTQRAKRAGNAIQLPQPSRLDKAVPPEEGRGFPAGVRPDSPSRGDAFLLSPYSTVHSVVLRWKLGWVEIMVFDRYTGPTKRRISI